DEIARQKRRRSHGICDCTLSCLTPGREHHELAGLTRGYLVKLGAGHRHDAVSEDVGKFRRGGERQPSLADAAGAPSASAVGCRHARAGDELLRALPPDPPTMRPRTPPRQRGTRLADDRTGSCSPAEL